MFAGIGRKLRIDVGGKVVEVKIGREVERVCVDVVGCVLELTRACSVSGEPALSAGGVALLCGTGTEMLALMMWTSAFGWFKFIIV